MRGEYDFTNARKNPYKKLKKLQFESDVYFKLQEAEREAEMTDQRITPKEVLKAMRKDIREE